MKKPPAVVAAIVVLLLLVLASLPSLLTGFRHSSNIGVLVVPGLVPVSHGIALYAILLRKRWGRVYSSVLLALWALALGAFTIVALIKTTNLQAAVVGIVIVGFLLWLICALAFGLGSRRYFSARDATDRTGETR